MTPEDAREFPSPEEVARWRDEAEHYREHPNLSYAGVAMEADEMADRMVRLADAYTVVVEERAQMIERLKIMHGMAHGWRKDCTCPTAAFLRSIREPQEMRDGE